MRFTDNTDANYEADEQDYIHGPHLEFFAAASKALTDFRKKWREDHADVVYMRDLELDYVPAMYDGNPFGFFIISEIDGETYDFAPAKSLPRTEESK